jgi:hypothetical protein
MPGDSKGAGGAASGGGGVLDSIGAECARRRRPPELLPAEPSESDDCATGRSDGGGVSMPPRSGLIGAMPLLLL